MRSRDTTHPDIRNIIAERVSRRGFLLGTGASMGAVAASGFVGSLFSGQAHAQGAVSSLTFTELKRVFDDKHRVADGYKADVVVGWGDPMQAGVGPGAYATRADVPDTLADGHIKIVPLRVAKAYGVSANDPDPRGQRGRFRRDGIVYDRGG